MHHALTIPELLHEIFQHVGNEDLGRNVSTVCKRWVDVSVRIVWRTLYDLTPLLRLIGEIEWEDHLTPGNDFVNTCVRLLSSQVAFSMFLFRKLEISFTARGLD